MNVTKEKNAYLKGSLINMEVSSNSAVYHQEYLSNEKVISNKGLKNEFSTTEFYSYGAEFDASVSLALYAKNIGIANMLSFFDPHSTVLDVLGGSGQIRRAYDQYISQSNVPLNIITGDIEPDMINRALDFGIDAMVLDACNLYEIEDDCYEGAILAYGFHHIPTVSRLSAIAEAIRITKRGGKVLIHDGIKGSSTDKTTKVTVDKYGKCPHVYDHPTRKELKKYLSSLKCQSYTEYDIFDPQVFLCNSSEEALKLFTTYYIQHYGLPTYFPQNLLTSEVGAVFSNHKWAFDEIGSLHLGSAWVQGKPYAYQPYLGKVDDDLLMRMRVSKDRDLSHLEHAMVVPRYAKLFVVEV